eukprot:Em0297g1a
METNKSELYSAEEQEDDFQTDSDAIYGNVVSENNSDGHGEVSENDSDDQGDDEIAGSDIVARSSNHSALLLLGRSRYEEIANLAEDEDGKEDVAKAAEDGTVLPIILRL